MIALLASVAFFAGTATAVSGSCSIQGDSVRFTLARASAAAGGPWKPDAIPSIVWKGTMADSDSSDWPAQLQIFPGNTGVLQTVEGWFPVTRYVSDARGITFHVQGKHEVAPNTIDRRIIVRASQILSSAAVWNRHDDRVCKPGAASFSIYCAGQRAVEDVTGGTSRLDHRRPALEVIRAVVDDRTADRNYHHRLMEYNNDPKTTLADVQSLFQEALERMSDVTWLRGHGFATE